MTEEQYNKRYGSKTIKQLCNDWRKEYIKIYGKWKDEETIKNIKKIEDEEIIKFGLFVILEDIRNDKNDRNN